MGEEVVTLPQLEYKDIVVSIALLKKAIDDLNASVNQLTIRLDTLEKIPADRWNILTNKIISKLVDIGITGALVFFGLKFIKGGE